MEQVEKWISRMLVVSATALFAATFLALLSTPAPYLALLPLLAATLVVPPGARLLGHLRGYPFASWERVAIPVVIYTSLPFLLHLLGS